MNNILFACDIDNTLIYSKKHPHHGWPCVEWIHEKEQAFMSPKTCELLCEIVPHVLFVPVTSRSVEQYLRIQWPQGAMPHLAITTHGARLLTPCSEDALWQDETQAHIAEWYIELHRMQKLLEPNPSFIRCRLVDEAYLFVYCAPGMDAVAMGDEIKAMTPLSVCVGGKKIYLLPPTLHKGTALQRLRQRFPQHTIIAAGDSNMDAEMLNEADHAIFPEAISPLVSTPGTCCPHDVLFSEFVVDTLQKILRS